MDATQYKNIRIISKIIAPKSLPRETRRLGFGSLRKCIAQCPTQYISSLSLFLTIGSRLVEKAHKTEYDDNKITLIFKDLGKNKLLTNYPYLAAVTTPLKCELSTAELEKYQQYKGMILLACIKLQVIGNHRSAISCALREIRLIAQNEIHLEIFRHLPAPQNYSCLTDLIDALDIIRADISNKTAEKFVSYLYVVLKDALKNKPGVTHRRELNYTPDVKESLSLSVSSPTRNIPYEITELRATNLHEEQLDEPSTQYSTLAIKYRDPTNTHKSIKLRYIQEKRLTEQLAYRKLSLPCSIEQLSDWDIRHLIKGIVNATQSKISMHTATMLLLVLLTGRGFEILYNELHNRQAIIHADGYKIFITHHSVPKSTAPPSLTKILPPVKSSLLFILPKLIGKIPFSCHETSVDEANVLIKSINKLNSTKITLGKIERYLEYWYRNHGIDKTEIAILKGQDYQQTTALSYSQINLNNIYKHHREYTESLFEKANLSPEFKPLKASTHSTGSTLSLPPNVLSNQFKLLASKITHHPDINNSTLIFDWHNQFIIYVWALLTFATGHRDVNAPLGKLSDFNPFNKTWWICDKAVKSDRSARLIIIPDTAIKQLDYYLEYLQEMIKWSKFIYPKIAYKCEASLKSTGNLFFALSTYEKVMVHSLPKPESILFSQ